MVFALLPRRLWELKRIPGMEARGGKNPRWCPSPPRRLRVTLVTKSHTAVFVAHVLGQPVRHGQGDRLCVLRAASSEGSHSSVLRLKSGSSRPSLLTWAPYSVMLVAPTALSKAHYRDMRRAIDVMGSAGCGSTRNVDSFP